MDGQAGYSVAYSAISFTDVSGLLLLMLCAYVIAAAALLAEHYYAKWRPPAGDNREPQGVAIAGTVPAGSGWLLIDVHAGVGCPLPHCGQLHESDDVRAELLAALSLLPHSDWLEGAATSANSLDHADENAITPAF